MTNDDVIAHLRSKLPEYAAETLPRSPKAGSRKYNCPFCGSGEGENGTGAFSLTPDGEHFKCFACGEHGDIFDLVGKINNIPGFSAQLRFVAEMYGIGHLLTTDTPIKRNDIKTPETLTTRAKTKPGEDYSDYCKQAEERLEAPEAMEYLKNRGILPKVAQECHLGFDPKWHYPKYRNPRTTTPCIIIPACNGHYTARNILPEIPKEDRYKKVGSVGLFHAEALDGDPNRVVFATEGEFDALSIMTVGRQAVALGSAVYSSLLTERLKTPRRHVLRLIFLPDIDKDKKGETSFEKLVADIRALGNPNILCAVFRLQDFCQRATFDAAQHAYLAPDGAILKDANDVLTHLGAIELGRALGAITEKAKQEWDAPPPANPPHENGKNEEPHTTQRIDTPAESTNAPHDIPDFQGIPTPPAEEDDDPRADFETHLHAETFDPDAPLKHRYPTGFPRLDAALGGGLKAGIYLIGATPGRGKTTFARQIADYIAAHQADTYVLFFSLEMERADMLARSLSRITFINSDTLPALTADRISEHWRDLEPDERKALDTARAEHFATGARRICSPNNSKDYTAEDISKYVVNFIKKIACGIPPVVIIDYAQYIYPADHRDTDKANMDRAMHTLRNLSRDYKIPMILVSSLNREAYEKQEMTMRAFKESGSLEYTASTVLGLQSPIRDNGTPDTPADPTKPEIRELDLCILKNRSGRFGGKIRLRYAAAYNYFEEI